MPADWTLSYSLSAVALPPSAAVCAVTTESVGGRRLLVGDFRWPLPTPSVSSACALISPIWAYIIADWSPDRQTRNDYTTSPRLFISLLICTGSEESDADDLSTAARWGLYSMFACEYRLSIVRYLSTADT